MEAVCLNTSALFDFNSLCVQLTSTSIPNSVITALVDSRSTHCFVDSKFACTHNLLLTSIPLIQLRLFNDTFNATITQSFQFLVTFDSGESMIVNMFVTLLNSSCSVVLGYNWLTCYNPSIDWVLGSIIFYPHLLESLTPSLTSSAKKVQLPAQNSTILKTLPTLATLTPASIPLCIALIGTAAFALAFKQAGVQSFRIYLSDPSFSAKSASISDEAPDLSNFPEEYHDFADVFSKAKDNTLAPHHSYDLKIKLEEGASLPINPCILSLSPNSTYSGSSLTNIFGLVLSVPPTPLIELQSSLFRKRMDIYDSVSTLGDLTKSLKRPVPSSVHF